MTVRDAIVATVANGDQLDDGYYNDLAQAGRIVDAETGNGTASPYTTATIPANKMINGVIVFFTYQCQAARSSASAWTWDVSFTVNADTSNPATTDIDAFTAGGCHGTETGTDYVAATVSAIITGLTASSTNYVTIDWTTNTTNASLVVTVKNLYCIAY